MMIVKFCGGLWGSFYLFFVDVGPNIGLICSTKWLNLANAVLYNLSYADHDNDDQNDMSNLLSFGYMMIIMTMMFMMLIMMMTVLIMTMMMMRMMMTMKMMMIMMMLMMMGMIMMILSWR